MWSVSAASENFEHFASVRKQTSRKISKLFISSLYGILLI